MIDSQLFWGMGWSVWLLPMVLVVPGFGYARYWNRSNSRPHLAVWMDSAWIGMAISWINVALIRELAIPPEHYASAILTTAAVWTGVGLCLPAKGAHRLPLPGPERLGLLAILVAVLFIGIWKSNDIARPLHHYWHIEGADDWSHEPLPIRPVDSVFDVHEYGGSGTGAFSFVPSEATTRIHANETAKGTITVAVQGPVGSTLTVMDKTVSVEPYMIGQPTEGPVRRYLNDGVAALRLNVNLEAGQSLPISASGERVFLMTGADSVWTLHADGTLKYVHYYQILNQVENQVWAQEMLEDRWATLNQPPGWSPLLTIATVLLDSELPAAGVLFLWVLLLIGLTAVRSISLLAPTASTAAFVVPAGMVMAHGLLMLEPGSQNFPDSLYSAAILGVILAITEQRLVWIVGLTIAAGLLRWPGVVVGTIFIVMWWKATGSNQTQVLKKLWLWVGIGAILAAIGVITGQLEDLLFILYFETFPEHWHGEYSPTKLLPRVPGFYSLWTVYTGGGLVLAAATAFFTPPSEARRNVRWLMASIGLYSLLLATIDHHPTHYFLPLLAVTGVAVGCASSALRQNHLKTLFPLVCLVGLGMFLYSGDVGIQPIEDMVVALESLLN